MNVDVLDFPIDNKRLCDAVEQLGIIEKIKANKSAYGIGQVSIQHSGVDEQSQLIDACGSLYYDYIRWDGEGEIPVKECIQEEDIFVHLCDYLHGTYLGELITDLCSEYSVYRGRFMWLPPCTSMTYHIDLSRRIHIPIFTNDDCFIIVDDELHRLGVGNVYDVNTEVKHTAVNASHSGRLHMVFCI